MNFRKGNFKIIQTDKEMKKKIEFLVTTIFIPSAVMAHNPGGAVMFYGIMFILSLIISLILLKRVHRHLTIKNKFFGFVVLFVIEIGLLFGLTIILSYTTFGILAYIFGG